jgi:hypothetical protein
MSFALFGSALSGFWASLKHPHPRRARSHAPRRGPATPPAASRLATLKEQHSDLDIAIAALLASSSCDALLLTRLKKRKLRIKDEIACHSEIAFKVA